MSKLKDGAKGALIIGGSVFSVIALFALEWYMLKMWGTAGAVVFMTGLASLIGFYVGYCSSEGDSE